MANDLSTPNPEEYGLGSFADLLPDPIEIPGDDQASLMGFRAHILKDLAPETPYEHVIAENIAAIEWDILQQRRVRDNLVARFVEGSIWEKYEAARCNNRVHGFRLPGNEGSADAAVGEGRRKNIVVEEFNALLAALRSKDPKVAHHAQSFVQQLGVDLLALMGQAQWKPELNFAPHDARIRSLEERRRRVKADYDALVRARPIEQAQVIDDN